MSAPNTKRMQEIEQVKKAVIVNVARNITTLMDHGELNQMQLANRSLVAQKTISNVLNGHNGCRIDILAAIAYALGVSPALLLAPTEMIPTGVRHLE